MTTIDLDKVKKLFYSNLLYELHIAKDKISFFEKKYNCNFESFKKKVKSEDENFETWDDYIEWKAYQNSLNSLEKEKADFESGNIRVA